MVNPQQKDPLIGEGTLELPEGPVKVRYELLPRQDENGNPIRVGSVVALDGEGHGVKSGSFPLELKDGSKTTVDLSPGIFGKASWEAQEISG